MSLDRTRLRSGPAAGALLLVVVGACTASTDTTAGAAPASTDPVETVGTAAVPAPTTTTSIPADFQAPVSTSVPAAPGPDPAPPEPALPDGSSGVAVAAAGGAVIAEEPDGIPFVRAHEGLVFPVVGRRGRWLEVATPCETTAWVDGDHVRFVPGAFGGEALGAGFAMSDAVVVLDPGHGGPNTGAVGPRGTMEKDLNLDIARRTRDLLEAPHAIDWETGAITEGNEIPAAGTVWVTRTEGPEGADIETGLVFRATLANVAGADALVSIHNNAAPDGPSEITGAEAYYRVQDAESKRLSGLVVEELRRGFASFDADWASAVDAGAKYRVRRDGATDLYGVLKDAKVPAVLVEGAYLTNPSEEALLLTPEFRQAYADSIYRALVRFLTTDDPGSGFVEPIRRTASPGSGSPQPSCTIPAQP